MELTEKAISLLKALIETPSLSREEDKTADLIEKFLQAEGVETARLGNNVWARNKHFNAALPTVLLNSHHDTVKPNAGYSKDPFAAIVEDGKLYGLGSNDAGGCLVSLMATFLHFYADEDLSYNLVLAASAEEEISGKGGIESLLPHLPEIDFAIVGEPTEMHLAVAEKGLMVLDCVVTGKAGHAARDEGENALYKAIQDIEWFRTFEFPKVSESLGPVKMSVTVIEAGKQHNVVPDKCSFVVDVRTTDAYSNQETLAIIREHVDCDVTPRSTRLNPSGIGDNHPIVKAGKSLGRNTYGSPTLSDQALMPFSSVKVGPGDSARSHTADEYVKLREIEEGIKLYITMLESIVHSR
ncbi:MAG: M20 family metallo-hydrolase [Roseivirga sp.]